MADRVKSVVSGDTVVLVPAATAASSQTERQLSLAFVTTPRFNSNDPYGFEAREYLRILLLMKPVTSKVLYSVNGRDYGDLSAPVFNSLIEKTLLEGTVKLRDDAPSKPGYAEYADRLEKAQAAAKAAQKGLWSPKAEGVTLVAQVPGGLYGSGRQIPSVVEKVVSGDRLQLRTMMDPNYHYVGPALIAGIRAPKTAYGDTPAQPFGDASRNFVAARLNQRSVRAQFVGPSPGNPNIPLVTLIHPAGDIALELVGQGLACVADQQAAEVGSERMSSLRAKQHVAETTGKNLWRGQVERLAKRDASHYKAFVIKVVSSDTIVLALGTDIDTGEEKTVQLSSIRAPRRNSEQEPYVLPAKEFVRNLLIGKRVDVHVDGVRPKSEQFPERELVTVSLDSGDRINVAVEIVEAGYALVSTYRRDDNGKSPFLDELLKASKKAEDSYKGLFSKRPPSDPRIVDASETVVRAKGYLASLERKKNMPAIVEHVFNAGRLKILIPSENCVINAVLAAVKVPRGSDYGASEADRLVFRRYNQRNVQINVKNVDKTGAFISLISLNGKHQSLSAFLVEEGLAEVHVGAAASLHLEDSLTQAESDAQKSKKGMWAHKQISAPADEAAATAAEPVVKSGYQDAIVTHVTPEIVSFVFKSASATLSKLEHDIALFFASVQNASQRKFERQPKKGEYVIAKLPSGKYVRAQIKEFERAVFKVNLLDSGETVSVDRDDLFPLPNQFSLSSTPALAVMANLTYIHVPPKGYVEDIQGYLNEVLANQDVAVLMDTRDSITVYTKDSKSRDDSVNSRIIEEGYSYLNPSDGSETYKKLRQLQEDAMKDRIGMWEYGDPRDDFD